MESAALGHSGELILALVQAPTRSLMYQRSDMLRYLLLFLEGGIYTDTDTTLLKSPGHWGQGARLWRDGAGWLESAQLDRLAAGESPDDVLGPPSVVVGVEADVGGREDWNDWWPRPVSLNPSQVDFADWRCKLCNGQWLPHPVTR